MAINKHRLEIWNKGLALAVEIAMLFAFGYWGYYQSSGGNRWLLAVIVPAAAIIIWSVWAAPKAEKRLKQPKLVIFKSALFLIAGLDLATVGRAAWAIVFLILAAINQFLEYRYDRPDKAKS